MAKSHGSKNEPPPSRLGRGLGALIPVPVGRSSTPPVAPLVVTTAPTAAVPDAPNPANVRGSTGMSDAPVAVPGLVTLRVDAIVPGQFQPREQMGSEALASLAASIKRSGLMQPVVVRSVAPGRYELIAGERRWRAIKSLGWVDIPAIVQEVGNQAAAELALIENLQREDLNPMDRAKALRRLADEFGLSHQAIGDRVGIDRATVSNLLRLNELDPVTAQAVRDGSVSMGHAKVLLGISDAARRGGLVRQAIQEGWSVRELEEAVRATSPRVPRGTSARGAGTGSTSAHVAQLQRALEEYLGTRVNVRVGRKKGAGEIRIAFHSLDEFDGLMQRIGFNSNRLIV